MESADDLLRNKSINDLRTLVASLESSATSKKTELQLTVGSKYHEFIESADAIGDMYNKACSIEENLRNFPEFTDRVISKTISITRYASNEKNSKSNVADSKSEQLLGDAGNHMPYPRKSTFDISPKTLWLFLDDCNVFEACQVVYIADLALNQCDKNVKTMNFIKSCQSTSFLRTVVVEDCQLLTHADLSSTEKARVFAAQSLLFPTSMEGLLHRYLAAAKLRVDTVLSKLNALVDATRSKLANPSLSTPNDGLENASVAFDLLDDLIVQIQVIVLDVFALFYKSMRESSDSNPVYPGMVALYQSKLAAELKLKCRDVDSMHPDARIQPVTLPSDFMSLLSSSSSSILLGRVFDQWLTANVIEPSSLCASAVLSFSSTTAEEVSALQKRLWTRISIINRSVLGYNQEEWLEACNMLVSVKKSPLDKSTLSSPWDPLWAMIFQGAFLAQVDRQLQESSSATLLRIKQLVVNELLCEGLKLKMESFELSVDANKSQSCHQWNYARVHHAAEKIRAALEVDILAIAGSTISPEHRAQWDETSGESLFSSTVYMKLSQLLSYLLIFLRECNNTLRQHTKKSMTSSNLGQVQLLSYGNAFIGRIAWLLLWRGSFLHMVLGQQQPQQQRSMKRDAFFGLSSEEQLMSAFEIADTNGDGVVTCEEADEAIQALAIGRSTDVEQALLSSILTPTLVFDEFALFILHLQAAEGHAKALHRVRSLLENLVIKTHHHIAESMAWYAIESSRDLHTRCFPQPEKKVKVVDMKSLWTTVTIPDNEGSIDAGDRVRVPGGASMSLLLCLESISSAISAFTSSSTIDSMILMDFAIESSPLYNSNLASQVHRSVMKHALAMIIERYPCIDAAEEVCLQVILDLGLCMQVFGHDVALESLSTAWKHQIDPVEAVLFLPVLDQITIQQFRNSCILLPWTASINTSSDEHALKIKIEQTNAHITLSRPTSRFALLPLPLALSSSTKLRDFPASVQPVAAVPAVKAVKAVPKTASKDSTAASSLMNSLGSFGNSFLGSK